MSTVEVRPGAAGPAVSGERAHDRDVLSGKAYDMRLTARLWTYVRVYRREFWRSLLYLVVASLALLAQPVVLKVAIDRYVPAADMAGLVGMGLLFLALTLTELVCTYRQYTLTMEVAQKALADLRADLFAHVQSLPMRYFDRNPVGRLVTRMTSDVDVIAEMFAAGALTIVMDLFTLTGIVIILFVLDARLAMVALALLPVMAFSIDFFRRKARRSYRAIRERVAAINAFLQEALSGMTIVQLFVQEERTYEEFERRNEAHRRATHRSNVYEASLFSMVEAVSAISVALTVWVAGGEITRGAIAFGTLVAFIEYIQKFFIPIRDFSTKYAVMQSAMAGAERVFALLDVPSAVTEGRTHRPEKVEGRIEFRDLSFAYKDDEPVLTDVSLTVEAGETVAIVGATGSGKTTLVKLLAGFYDVAPGTVFIDGVDVRAWDLPTLRRNLAIVLQDVTLFSGDVAYNITLGRPEIDEARMIAAAEAVHAHDFVRRLPRGYAEPVRERGNNFSAGQRQLISFARALAQDPPILILDEATSSVDPETEVWIQDALDKLLVGRTAIVIAHRLSTIERADRIVVLHHGTVREVGTHAELLAAEGIYAKLHRLQFATNSASAVIEPVHATDS